MSQKLLQEDEQRLKSLKEVNQKVHDRVPVASVEQFPYLQKQKATDILLDLLSAGKQSDDDKQGY